MKKYPITIFLAFQLIFSCTSPTQPAPDISKDFHLPIIIEKPALNNIEYQKVDSLTEVYFKFINKFKFADTVKLEFDNEAYIKHSDEIPPSDFLDERYEPKPKDSLTTDGFQIFPDYKTSIYYKQPYDQRPFCYFPVYVVN
jgi:hypothetical protein